MITTSPPQLPAFPLDHAKSTSSTRGSRLGSCAVRKDTQPVQGDSCGVDQLPYPGQPSGQPGQCTSGEGIV